MADQGEVVGIRPTDGIQEVIAGMAEQLQRTLYATEIHHLALAAAALAEIDGAASSVLLTEVRALVTLLTEGPSVDAEKPQA